MAKKKKASYRKPARVMRSRRPRPRPRPVWLRLGPPEWLQNSPGLWIQVTFVRSLGRTVQIRVGQKGSKARSTVSLALSRVKKRLKKSR